MAIHASLYEFARAAARQEAHHLTAKYIRERPDPRESKTKPNDLFHYRTQLIFRLFIAKPAGNSCSTGRGLLR